MNELEQLEQAIAALEAQRATLGDAVVDAALGPMQRQLADLQEAERKPTPASEGERKLVTVMFADISGFTALSEKMDPELVRDMMNACFERLVPVVEKYGGVVDKFIGDEIMALFGAPVAHENDPQRALRAALGMMDALAEFNAERDTDLGVHFGINTGLAIAGSIGTGERQEYSVMGDAVNVASRLEDVSQRGEILVGPDTYRLTAPLFTFETLEPVRVKGKAEPVQVHRLVGLKAEPGRVRGLETRGISSPLVGRDAELAALEGCIEQLTTGQGGIVSIIGEAGVGKSRLMAEIRDSIAGADGHFTSLPVQWLEGRTLSFGQTISYWPFQEILWRYAGITEDDGEAEVWHKLESRVAALFPENIAEILPYLATLLTLEVKGEYVERVKYLDGEAMGRQVFLASRRFFERLAQAQPLVLVFEDLHWVDESSALLLEHLLPLVERVGLLICGVSRPYRATPAARLREIAARDYADRYTEIALPPLSQADSAQLVRNLLAIEDLPLRVRGMIVRKAEGNPFFLEEIIRTLVDAGAVVHEPATGRWRATTQVETIAIPDTVQGVIMARVDRLDEDVKQALRTAAVIGRNFLYRVLRAVAEADRQLDRNLAELQAIELIREKQRVPELEYIFKHALAQEATYESILLQKRRELHARVSQAIEALFADRLEEFYGLLAYHYARAEAWEKAQDYLLKAGDQAGRMAADAEALAHYRQALTAYTHAFGDRWDPLQRAVLERKIGEAFFRRGEHQQAFEYLQRALTYLGSPFPASRWGVRLAIARELIRQVGHRLSPGLFLKNKVDQADPVVEERINIYEVIAWIDYYLDQERFLLDTVTALNVAERNGFPFGMVRGYAGVGIICDIMSMPRLAEHYHRQAVALAEQIQHPTGIGLAYLGLGLHEIYVGHWGETTVAHLQRAAKTYWETGDLREWGTTIAVLGQLSVWKGEFIHNRELCQELIQIGQDGSDLQLRTWGSTGLGKSWPFIGSLDEAITQSQKAAKVHEAAPNYPSQVDALGWMGSCYLRQGNLEMALAVLEEADRLIAAHSSKGHLISSARNGLAEAYLVAAERAEEPQRAGWMRKAKRACQAAMKQGKVFCGGMPHALRLQGRYEWLRGKPAAARKWWQQSLALAKELGARYELGMTRLEMGRRLGELAHLERAEATFTEIDAKRDLARAREALAQARMETRPRPHSSPRKSEGLPQG